MIESIQNLIYIIRSLEINFIKGIDMIIEKGIEDCKHSSRANFNSNNTPKEFQDEVVDEDGFRYYSIDSDANDLFEFN